MSLKNRVRGRKLERVMVPEWGEGEHVWLREMSGLEQIEFDEWQEQPEHKALSEGRRGLAAMARLVRLSLANEQGELVGEDEDEQWLVNECSSLVLRHLAEATARLNGMGLETAEQARKNSEPLRSGGLDSGSVSLPAASILNGR